MSTTKRLLHKMFHQPESRLFVVTNDLLAVVTMMSIIVLVLETVTSLEPYHQIFLTLEYIAVSFFILEYIARVVVAESKRKYVFSFFGIIDALAILPSILLLTNLTFLKSARVLHVVRFLRTLRLLKVMHVREKHHGTFRRFAHLEWLETEAYFFALAFSVLFFGTLLFIFEGHHTGAENIPLAMLWVGQVILGGITHLTPDTAWGEVVIIATRFTGLLLFGFLIHIVGEYINKFFFGHAHLETKPLSKRERQAVRKRRRV